MKSQNLIELVLMSMKDVLGWPCWSLK